MEDQYIYIHRLESNTIDSSIKYTQPYRPYLPIHQYLPSLVRTSASFWAWPAITYISVSHYIASSTYEEFIASHLFGNALLMLTINRITGDNVHKALWYSRKAASPEEYRSFYKHSLEARDTHRVEYIFGSAVATEIESLGLLPRPFHRAYPLCKLMRVSQRLTLNCFRGPGGTLATTIYRDGLTMPAVVIGDAAHALPHPFSADSINVAL